MHKFMRNCMTAAVLAFGLAACGDDVTITQPPEPPAVPNITSFSVAPAAVTLTAGQVVQASYNLQLAPGLTGTVAWISGTTTVATVDATGKITAVAPGTAVITATATSGGQTTSATIGVTVVAAPVVDAITSFTVSPGTATLTVGQATQASYNLQLLPGIAGAVSWASSATTIATVNAAGQITAVAPGTAVITATATAAGQTSSATIGVTVVPVVPASLSIASVTQGLLTLPVNLSNVNGQIEINLNFDPGAQLIDSVVSYIGTKRAAVQSFSPNAIPAAGVISMSVNTANFRKNFNQAGVATPGATQVDFLNGPTTINAIVFPKQTTGQSAGNCTNAPPGVAAVCSSNTFSIILNNTDSWAADMTKPTTTATAANTSAAPGQTFWGGPAAGSNVSATLYPVIYTPGRSITTVTWTIGGCNTVVQTALPFTQSFGYTAAPTNAQTTCVGYEWTGGNRDNVVVAAAIDNGANVYGPFAGLIPNTVVFNSTPDSIRLDYAATSVNTPDITRTLPAVTGWVNAAFNFINFASSDAGVGLRATRDRAVTYSAPNCGGATNVAMPNGTGADIPECASNFIGGAVGLGGTAPYTVRGTESDRLGNVGTSSATATFGVDKTAPQIRWGLVQAAPALVVSVSAQTSLSAKPTTQRWRAEYLDDRAGFYNAGQPDGTPIAAQTHMLSLANHANPTGLCVVGTAPIGATFVTNPGCGLVSITVGNILRLDGWQAGMDVPFPASEAYYGYRTLVTDAAGNNSSALFQNAYVNANAPFATGLGLPAQITNAIFPVSVTAADSVEVINAGLGIEYPNVPTATWLRYNRTSVGTTYNDAITSPINTTLTPPTGAPYVRSLEVVDGTAFPGYNINVAPTNVKPINVQAWSFNPANFFTGSAVIAIPALNVQDGQGINAWNVANPTLAVNHFRVIATLSGNQYGSTVPVRAQVVAPTNSPNAPFTRVDFYRLDAGGTWYNYLGSVSAASALGSDQGTYRSWIYGIAAPYVATWNGTAQSTTVTAGQTIIAVGVVSNGDAVTTTATVMVP